MLADSLLKLGLILVAKDEGAEAEQCFQEAIHICQDSRNEKDKVALESMSHLASLLRKRGDRSGADELIGRVEALRKSSGR